MSKNNLFYMQGVNVRSGMDDQKLARLIADANQALIVGTEELLKASQLLITATETLILTIQRAQDRKAGVQ